MASLGELGELASKAREAAAQLFRDRQGQVDETAVIATAEELVRSIREDPKLGVLARLPLAIGMITGYVHEWNSLVEAASSARGDLVVIYAPGEELDTDTLVPPHYPKADGEAR